MCTNGEDISNLNADVEDHLCEGMEEREAACFNPTALHLAGVLHSLTQSTDDSVGSRSAMKHWYGVAGTPSGTQLNLT